MAHTITWDELRDLAAFEAEKGCAISLYLSLDPSVTPTPGDADTRLHSLLDEAAKGDGARLRRWCAETAGLTLGIGLSVPGVDPDGLFRIGHMGHLNPPMLLGTLATIEAGLAALGIAHGPGALESAARIVAGTGETAPGRLETVDLSARIG